MKSNIYCNQVANEKVLLVDDDWTEEEEDVDVGVGN